uniref:ATP-dependent DNA helicase n=1 Tax=Globodera pallida TaxID=36090 RepID=A0A183CN26_GLOPA
MLGKGNKLGYMSFLRQLVNEMLQFRSAAALEERRLRGHGICVSPGTRGWDEFDGWQGIEFPASELTTIKAKVQQQPDFAASFSLSANKSRSTRSSFRWLNCSGPIASWTHSTTPIGLAPVKHPKQECLVRKPIVPEHKKGLKQPAQWMAIVKGKAVPLPSGAARKPVEFPIGYAPIELAKSLRGGGSRERLMAPIRLQCRCQAPQGKRLDEELHTTAQLPQQLLHPLLHQRFHILLLLPPQMDAHKRNSPYLLQAQPRLQEHQLAAANPVRALHKQAVLKKRYSSSSLERWPDVPISCICKNNTHTGFCASQSANHTPRYYNCLVPFGDKQLYRCPHCDALLLKSEASGQCAFSKCCAKGQVKMERQFYELQRPFLRPTQRQQKDEEEYNQLDDNTKQLDLLLNDLIMGRHALSKKFIKCVDRYNHEMAFGTATTEQKPVPGGYQPVKMNGMVTYRLSGINPPRNADGSTRDELCGQVWTLNPDDAIELRKRRNMDANLKLDDELLQLLHQLLAHQQIGHPLSGLYFHLKRVYEEAKEQQAQGQ